MRFSFHYRGLSVYSPALFPFEIISANSYSLQFQVSMVFLRIGIKRFICISFGHIFLLNSFIRQ